MSLKFFLYLALLLVSGCAESPEKSDQQTAAGEAATEPQIVSKFRTQNDLPFAADTTLFFHIEGCDSLGSKEVRALAAYWYKNDLVSNIAWQLQEFYMIDSIKAIGQYDRYCDTLDIGETKRANAYAICKLRSDSNLTLLVWSLTSSSYEACPYHASQNVYFTIVKNGQIGDSFLLGEYESAGDPPVSMERIVSGRIHRNLSIELDVFIEQDEDMDQPEIEITREKYQFAVRNGRLVKVSEQKEAPRKVKRQVTS